MSLGLSQPATSGVLTDAAMPTTVAVTDVPGVAGAAPGPDAGRTGVPPPPGGVRPNLLSGFGSGSSGTLAPSPTSRRVAVSWSRTISPGAAHQRPASIVTRSMASVGVGRP